MVFQEWAEPSLVLGFRVKGLEFRVCSLGLRAQGLGHRVTCAEPIGELNMQIG